MDVFGDVEHVSAADRSVSAACLAVRRRYGRGANGGALYKGRRHGHTARPRRRRRFRTAAATRTDPHHGDGGSLPRITTTDASGRYEFTELPGALYTVMASKGGYVQLSYGQTRSLGAGKPVEILDGQIVEDIDFALPPGAVITGRVVDEFGNPAEEAVVAILRPQNIDGARQLGPLGTPSRATTSASSGFSAFRQASTTCRPTRAIGLPARRLTPASHRSTRRRTFPAPPIPPRRSACRSTSARRSAT